MEESAVNQVPLVAIPFYGDQPRNARQIKDLGIGLILDHSTLTKETLKETIIEVAENKT